MLQCLTICGKQGGSASEGEYRSEEDDSQRNTSIVTPPIPIVVAPTPTPKKRGRPLKAVTEARLSALYHGASTIEKKESNGAPGSFDGAQTTPTLTPKKRGRPPKAESEKVILSSSLKLQSFTCQLRSVYLGRRTVFFVTGIWNGISKTQNNCNNKLLNVIQIFA